MNQKVLLITVAGAAMTFAAHAQTSPRRADLRGGGNPSVGKCTIEVVVDGAAQVEVRGDSALLRNLKGQPPQWRRFVCTSPMPANPAEFRFTGVDGRGRQELVRDPRQGGAAIVEINDPDNGTEGYTFDLTWSNGPVSRDIPDGRRPGPRFSVDQAVESCQAAVRQQAQDRFRTDDVRFRQTNIDDQPGRNDWVVGSMEVRDRSQATQVVRFSCSVDFDSGRIRTAQIDQASDRGVGGDMRSAAIQNCQRAVQERARRDGYDQIDFGRVAFDDQPGRNDWVVGDFRANGRYGQDAFRFSCSVDLRGGDVRSVDVTPLDRRR